MRTDIPDGYAQVNPFRQAGFGRELTVVINQNILMPDSRAACGQINRSVALCDMVRQRLARRAWTQIPLQIKLYNRDIRKK